MTSSKGKICWDYTVWRKGKWSEGILVLKGIYVYKGTCPSAALSFFLSSSRNVLYSYSIQLDSLSLLAPRPSLSLPRRPSCPRPRLAQSPRLRPHRAKSALVTPPSESRKVASPAAPRPSTASSLRPRPFPLPSPRPRPSRVPWIPFPFLARRYRGEQCQVFKNELNR
jgi:hypothetical protein